VGEKFGYFKLIITILKNKGLQPCYKNMSFGVILISQTNCLSTS